MKLTIYSREVRDYYNGEEITQYMLAPETGEKRDYVDTDCLAVSRARLAGMGGWCGSREAETI